ncbi:hypothetical protein [Stackebrandtia nassauensis]|uniref:Uncharacterized protein n=1 Tax=Stackebrandtia nassauensis (strain DSM 44728 / CIP 108903 / NRRL B-16338 / NBRC 102104 / LLR-40K-21) TaxID=446470 RepID=D3Q7T3_STANL|nr:hypothetical protein [Stackebrandtia nassauensis]ADD44425.1 hypothetical protein Snas_4784 [Stackebrandtia nassauensis DSM 44728]
MSRPSVRPKPKPLSARVLFWTGLVLVALPLPVMAVTESSANLLSGDLDDVAQAVGFCAPFVGYPMVVAGRFMARLARDGDAALPTRFERAPRLRWSAGFGRSFLNAAIVAIVGIAVMMLAWAGLTSLFTGETLSFDTQPLGAVGEGVMAFAISGLLTATAWMILGLFWYGGLVVGYSLWRLGSRNSNRGERSAAGMVVAAVLVVIGVTGVVVAGNAGLPADNTVLRGLMATVGALLLVVPLAYAISVGWRQGQRPWGFTGKPDEPGKIIAAVFRLFAALALLTWLVTALLRAWQP